MYYTWACYHLHGSVEWFGSTAKAVVWKSTHTHTVTTDTYDGKTPKGSKGTHLVLPSSQKNLAGNGLYLLPEYGEVCRIVVVYT